MRFPFLFSLIACIALSELALSQEANVSGTPVPADPPELLKLKASLDKSLTEAGAAVAKQREQVKAAYLNAIESMQNQAMQKGDLDQTIATKAEAERIRRNDESAAQAMPAELRAWRDRYQTALRAAEMDAAKTETAVRHKYIAELQALQVDFTKLGKIEQALAVKKEREAQVAVASSVAAAAAPPVLPPAATQDSSPPSSMPPPSPVRASPTPSLLLGRSFSPTNPAVIAEFEAKIVGTWDLNAGGNSFKFEPGGVTGNSWRKPKGYWKIIGPNRVEFSMAADDPVRKGTFSPDFKSMTFIPKGNATAATKRER